MEEHPLTKIITGICDEQPPEWRLGIHTAQHMLLALNQADDDRAKVAGAILMSYIALSKTEGYAAGTLGVVRKLRETATPDGELVAFLQQTEEALFEQKTMLYNSIFVQLMQHLHTQEQVRPLPEGLAELLQRLIEGALSENT